MSELPLSDQAIVGLADPWLPGTQMTSRSWSASCASLRSVGLIPTRRR
jgi:hypothetical protein